MQNIAISFVKLGQFSDAVTSFEHIMTEEPSFRTGLNLILCYFALQDRDNMKHTFERLLMTDLRLDDEHKYATSPQVCRQLSWCSIHSFIHLFICFFNNATDNTQWTYNK